MQSKRLVRSRSDRLIAGVAGGLAAYLNVDPLLVRLGLLIFGMLNGAGVLLYLLLWLLVPNEESSATDAREQVRENVGEMQAMVQSLVQRVQGLFNP